MSQGKWQRELTAEIRKLQPDKVIVVTDSNVRKLFETELPVITVPAGERSKDVVTLSKVWKALQDNGATRHSLVVNIGGGVVTDLGGFAAGTFKRGIRHINIPTSLLGMADAAIGGKTGIDFNGLKNEIGVFKMPERVILDSTWLDTLPYVQLVDGFAEVVKSAMLGSCEEYESLQQLPDPLTGESLRHAAEWSGRFKEEVVKADPTERGLRRILNLGHTAGHAFETLAAREGHPIGHGVAVAHGLLMSLLLSVSCLEFDPQEPVNYADNILGRFFPPLPQEAKAFDKLLELMGHDKKNPKFGEIAFVLLREIGEPVESVIVTPEQIAGAYAHYQRITDIIYG